MDEAFGHWLAGFIDGEGCFGIHRLKREGRICWALRFTLKLRSDDQPILEKCQRRTGAGCIRETKPPGHNPQAIWIVESRGGCEVIAAILDHFPLRAKKARDYAIWGEALREWGNGDTGHRWSGQRDWSRIAGFRAQLDETRAFSQK